MPCAATLEPTASGAAALSWCLPGRNPLNYLCGLGLLHVQVAWHSAAVVTRRSQPRLPCCSPLQVHDIDGRVSHVVSLLRERGFSSVHVEQPGHLAGTDLYNLYAVR